MAQRNMGFWMMQAPGWFLVVYLIYAQAISAFDYDLGVAMGTQEPASQITDVGVAFWWGFAFGDLVFYIPLMMLGLIGHWLSKTWGVTILSAALGITVYWPIVALASLVDAQSAEGWNLATKPEYWIILPLIMIWAVWGLRDITMELQSLKRTR